MSKQSERFESWEEVAVGAVRGNFRLIAAATLALTLPFQRALAESNVDISTGVTYVQRDAGPLKADIYVPKAQGRFQAYSWCMAVRGR